MILPLGKQIIELEAGEFSARGDVELGLEGQGGGLWMRKEDNPAMQVRQRRRARVSLGRRVRGREDSRSTRARSSTISGASHRSNPVKGALSALPYQ